MRNKSLFKLGVCAQWNKAFWNRHTMPVWFFLPRGGRRRNRGAASRPPWWKKFALLPFAKSCSRMLPKTKKSRFSSNNFFRGSGTHVFWWFYLLGCSQCWPSSSSPSSKETPSYVAKGSWGDTEIPAEKKETRGRFFKLKSNVWFFL